MQLSPLKEIVSDPNISLWHESEDIDQKKKKKKKRKCYFQNFSWFQFCVYKLWNMYDYVHGHCSVDNCVKLILVAEDLCENCFYFTLKWFLLNSFGEMCFLEVSYLCKKIQIQILEIFESTLYMKFGIMPLRQGWVNQTFANGRGVKRYPINKGAPKLF